MSEKHRIDGIREETLHAYHDGELQGLRRWRFERALRRSPALRAELDQLASLRTALREHDADASAPDLWDAIALRLPAADARRADAGPAAGREAGAPPAFWWKSLGAAVATAAVAWVAFYGGLFAGPTDAGSVIRWIDTGDRGVMVLDDDPETTIIWVFDDAPEGAWSGGRRDEA